MYAIRSYYDCDGSVEHFEWLVAEGVPFKPVFYPHYSGEPPTDDGLVYSGSETCHPYCDIAQMESRAVRPREDHQVFVLAAAIGLTDRAQQDLPAVGPDRPARHVERRTAHGGGDVVEGQPVPSQS